MSRVWSRAPWLLGAIVCVLYSVSLGHNLLFDEENIILRNPHLGSFANIPLVLQGSFFKMGVGGENPFLAYYRPLSTLSFMVDYHFWKTDPMGYNLTSLLCHLSLALAFYALLRRLLKNEPSAFTAALLYAIHPIHTEAVGHVSCRSETLAALFLVLSIHFYLKNKRPWIFLFQGLAFLCKESSVLIPLFLAAADLAFFEGGWRQRIRRLAPFALFSAAYMVMRKMGIPIPMVPTPEPFQDRLLRVLSMSDALTRYFKTIFFPPYFQLFGKAGFALQWKDPKIAWTVAFYVVALFALIDAWRRRSRTSFFGIFLFLGGFIPYIHLVHFYPEWAEHFLTVPALGIFILLGLTLRAIFGLGMRSRALYLIPFLMWGVFLAEKTYQRNALYNDLDRYYETLSKSDSPYAIHGFHERAKLKMADSSWSEAQAILTEALNKPLNQDITWSLMGHCAWHLGDTARALECYEKAASLEPDIVYYSKEKAMALAKLGRYPEAAAIFADVRERNASDYTVVRYGMAMLELMGDSDGVRAWAERGLNAFQGKALESAAIAHAYLRSIYRAGRRDVFSEQAKIYAERYPDAPWHGAALRMYARQLSADDFLALSRERFADFYDAALVCAAIALSLDENKSAFDQFMSAHEKEMAAWAEKDELSAKDIQRLKEDLA